MLPTGLESISYNLNRKNNDLLLFEFGKTYSTNGATKYQEQENLAIYFSGAYAEGSWKEKESKTDIYFAKGICNSVLTLAGLENYQFAGKINDDLLESFNALYDGIVIAEGGIVSPDLLERFSIKQPVFYVRIIWQQLMDLVKNKNLAFVEIPKFPHVKRDLSIIVDKKISYQSVENSINSLQLSKLTGIKLFDLFESEKLGKGKKSFAIAFTFLNREKTLTDKEVDVMMGKIIDNIKIENDAEIRNS